MGPKPRIFGIFFSPVGRRNFHHQGEGVTGPKNLERVGSFEGRGFGLHFGLVLASIFPHGSLFTGPPGDRGRLVLGGGTNSIPVVCEGTVLRRRFGTSASTQGRTKRC